jgi:3-oxoacyl-[acyl-carrier protein] reductase
MTNDTSLLGQVALVTGGGGGIGSAISRRLAGAGASVVITWHTDESKARRVAAQIAECYGRLDLLVNNAGITTPVPHADLDGLSDEWIDRIFQTNWRGAFATIRACQELLLAGDGGTVVNLSSVAAVTGIGSNVAYCASKAAMDSMTRSLARALAPKVRVVSVSPGWVLGEYAKRMDPAYIQEQTDLTPLKRLASPEDVAETVWAVAAKLTFMTGNIVPVDGGRPLA